jgi:hypothetical protein
MIIHTQNLPPEDGRAAAEVSPARLGLLGDALAPVLRGEPKPALRVPMEVEPVVQRERVFAKLFVQTREALLREDVRATAAAGRYASPRNLRVRPRSTEIWEGIRKIGLIFGAKKFSGHDPDFGPRVSGEKWAADRARARRVHGGKL